MYKIIFNLKLKTMNKKLFFFIHIVTILVAFIACKNDSNSVPIQQEDLSLEAQTALDIVNTFRKQVAPSGMSRSISSSDLNILDCQQEEVLLRKTENSESTLARPTADEIEKVSLYNIKFELNGKKGFAYSSPDLRINRVLAYCENGLIEDTIYIKGMAMAIKGITQSCANDLNEYYSNDRASSRTNEKTSTNGPFMLTEWSQDAPYNENCGSGCSTTNNGKYPAGCVGIAVAQSVAFLNKYDSQFNLAALKKEKHIYSFSPLAAEVAKFVYHVAAGCKTDFACSGSGSTLAKATDYLQSIGYNQDFLDYYYRKASSIDNQLIGCLLMDRPVCVGGNTGKGNGHAWVFDGISATTTDRVGEVKKILALHCNWGWGGLGNGWYDNGNWYNPVDQTTFEPISDNGSFYRNNEYIYFRYTRR